MDSQTQLNNFPPPHHVIFIIIFSIVFVTGIGVLGFFLGGKTALFLVEGLIIVPAFIYSIYFNYDLKNIFRLKKISLQLIFVSIIIGFGIAVISDGLDRLFQIFLPMPEIFEKQLMESLKINSVSEFIIIFLSAVIFAGLFEEMLFRGFVQTTFEKTFNITPAILITAIVFGMIHMNPWWLIQISFLGIFLGIMAWKSESIFPSMIVHFINNGLSLIFINSMEESYHWYLNKEQVYIPIIVVSVVVTVFGFWLFFKICKK